MENFICLKGYPLEIELVRGPDYPALFRANAAGEGKFTFTEFILNIPIVEPSNPITLDLLKRLKDSKPYLFSFRQRHGMFTPIPQNVYDFQLPITTDTFTERPQMIWIGFQHGTTTDQKLYSNENVETMQVRMNNEPFPTTMIKANWTDNDNGFFYEMQTQMRAIYLQYPATYTEGNMLTPANFKDLYTIYCFDVSKQEYALKGNSISCHLHVHFKAQTVANLRVYVAWYSDRTLELFTDGRPRNIKRQTDSFII